MFLGYDQQSIYKYYRKLGARVGENCYIGVRSLGSEPYLVTLGNHVWISEEVSFHTHDGGVWVLQKTQRDLKVFGTIVIEDNCLIGRGAHLLSNVRIGTNSIVGPGSVVISDIPPNSIVMGVPARPISSISKYEERCLARWKVQKPPALDTSQKHWFSMKKNKDVLKNHLLNVFKDQEKPEAEPGK